MALAEPTAPKVEINFRLLHNVANDLLQWSNFLGA